jgi:hypothetical protein
MFKRVGAYARPRHERRSIWQLNRQAIAQVSNKVNSRRNRSKAAPTVSSNTAVTAASNQAINKVKMFR